jgi:Ni,Fe-hydrogenase III large subunit
MDEIADIMQQIERLRSKLVDFTIQTGDFMHEGVLHHSRRLDELIIKYYGLMTHKESTDVKIA